MQFFTRAFAAGIRKVCVMDASKLERVAVKAYVEALPWPFPMERSDRLVKVESGQVVVYRHLDGRTSEDGEVWVLWPVPGRGEAIVRVPVTQSLVVVAQVDGTIRQQEATNGIVSLTLPGDAKMAPPILILDRKNVNASHPKL